MEEKERYEISFDGYIYDIYDNDIKRYLSDPYITRKENLIFMCNLLNQQDKENQQLKQQLNDLPKKIVEEIKENFDWKQCCEIRKYYDQQYIWFNYVAFNDFLDTILKKYGGENEIF